MSEVPLVLATLSSKVHVVFMNKQLRIFFNILGFDPAEQLGHSV